jgi:lantibiotic modifying enzyme
MSAEALVADRGEAAARTTRRLPRSLAGRALRLEERRDLSRAHAPAAVRLLRRVMAESAATVPATGDSPPVLRPFMAWAQAHVRSWSRVHGGTPPADWHRVGSSLLADLAADLERVARPTLRLDAEIRRLRGSAGRHPPATDADEGARALLMRYGGLARLLADRCLAWQARCERFREAFVADHAGLAALAGRPLGELRAVRRAASASARPHPELEVQFACGAVLVFTARASRLRPVLGEVIAWLGLRLLNDPLTLPPSLSVGHRAWTLRPPAAPHGATARVSYRFGVLLASLHALGAVGLHQDDVAMDEAGPSLVSLEHWGWDEAPRGRSRDAETFLATSVARVGLLGHDACGDGAPPDLRPLGRGPTDEGRAGPVAATMGGHALAAAEVERGFVDAWRLLAAHGKPIEAQLRSAAGTERRPLRRARVSRACLDHAAHPDHLRTAADRQAAIRDVLARAESLAPVTRAACDSERAALERGELPEPAEVGRRRARLHLVAAHDLPRELLLLRSLLAPARDVSAPRSAPAAETRALGEDERAELLEGAVEIGRCLEETALPSPDGMDWIGLHEDERGRCRLRPAGPDLYHGGAGIATFFAYLWRATGRRRFRAAALSAMRRARVALANRAYWTGGAFCGRASVAYGALHVARVCGDAALLAEAVTSCRVLARDSPARGLMDLVGGNAGAQAVILAVRRATGADGLLEEAALLGRRIVAARSPLGVGCAWPSRLGPSGLAGFAHGSGGIAWALAHLTAEGAASADTADAIRGALAHERSLFVEEERNWLDLRAHREPERARGGRPPTALAWCHGAPGIGIARATLPSAFFGPEEAAEVRVAVESVLRAAVDPTDSLCHGELGNLETLLLAGTRLAEPSWLAIARRRGLAAVRRARSRARIPEGWTCGISVRAPTPGLLVGLSGIGYALLRLWDPAAHPSLLAVEPSR